MTPTDSSKRDPLAGVLLRGGNTDADSSRANSRAALVEAALEEFTANGYEATTVAAIADRAGVTTGALYAHFTGKLDLLLAAVGLTPIDAIDRTIDDLASQPAAALVSWLTRGLGAAPDDRTVLLLDVIVLARRDRRIANALRSGLEAYVAATTRAVRLGDASGAIDPALEPAALSRLLALVSLGMTVFSALDAPAPPSDAFAELAELLFHPLASAVEEPAALARVRTRAANARRATAALEEALAEAVAAGHSLRQVGTAAGLSHERVRQITTRRATDI